VKRNLKNLGLMILVIFLSVMIGIWFSTQIDFFRSQIYAYFSTLFSSRTGFVLIIAVVFYIFYIIFSFINPTTGLVLFFLMLPSITRSFHVFSESSLQSLPVTTILFVVALGYVFKKQGKFSNNKLLIIILLYDGWILFESLFSKDPYKSFVMVFFIILNVFIIYFLSAQKRNDISNLRKILSAIIINGVIFSIVDFLVLLPFFRFSNRNYSLLNKQLTLYLTTEGIPRGRSIFPNANMFAMLLFFSIESAIILLFLESNKKRKPFFLAALVTMLIALIFTQSRSAILAVLVSTLIFVLLVSKSKVTRLIFVFSFVAYTVLNLFPNLTNFSRFNKGLADRLDLWTVGIKISQNYPLIGIGIGAWKDVTGLNLYAHSTYITALVEGGVPCLLFIVLLIFIPIGISIRNILSVKNTNSYFILCVGMTAIAIGSAVQQIFEYYSFGILGGPEFNSVYFLFFLFSSFFLSHRLKDKNYTMSYKYKLLKKNKKG